MLPVNANIHLQYKGAGALTDAVVTIDVYPKNKTEDGGLLPILLCIRTLIAGNPTHGGCFQNPGIELTATYLIPPRGSFLTRGGIK